MPNAVYDFVRRKTLTIMSKQIKLSLSFYERKILADLWPEFGNRWDLKNTVGRTLTFTLDELQQLLPTVNNELGLHRAMRRNAMRHIIEVATQAIEDSQGIGAIPVAERLYQFRILLKQSKPEIWRRIQVKRCTLDKLHEHIQTAMGWTNSHLHQFNINSERYGDPELLDDGFEDDVFVDSTDLKIDQILPKSGKRFRFEYEYDFGDSWRHEVLFEGCLKAAKGQRFPLCVEGERACPPEDVGGIRGYARYLKVLRNSLQKDHQDMLDWRGPFDPDSFDGEKTSKRMRRGLPDWRQMDC